MLDFMRGFLKGIVLTAFFLIIYFIWDARPRNNKVTNMSKKEKIGCYVGAFVNFSILYFSILF